MKFIVTDYQKYRHGYWKRIGDQVKCYCFERTIPAGLIPADIPLILSQEYDNKMYYIIIVRIRGWENCE